MIPLARRSRRIPVVGAVIALAIALVAALAPAAALAADPSAAPDRGGAVTVIREGTPDRGVAVDPVPVGTVRPQSSIGYLYDDGTIAVVGEVYNNASSRRGAVLIEVTYYNDNDVLLGEHEDYVILDRVARNGVGPFVLFDETPPTGIDTYRIRTITSQAVTAAPVGALEILNSTSSIVTVPDIGDVRRFQGTIRNPNSFAVTGGTSMVTAYQASGDVLDASWDFPSGGTLAAGESAPYTMDISVSDDPTLVYHHARILADGFRSGTTSYVTSWANYFNDLGTSSFRDDIVWLAEQGITSGCAPGRFCPTANVRRDEMASFLARALGLTGTAPNAFSDDNGNTHEANINRLAQAGITSGCSAGKYCPAASVRRDAMASFLARALELTGAAPDAFTDDNGNTHEANINRLKAAGVTDGCGGTKYCPTANVTRGQMAAFLRRAFE
jgi:hypothetical protein